MPTPPAFEDGSLLDSIFFNSSYTSLARILDMNFSKVSKVTEIHVTQLAVDVHLTGFDQALLKRTKIPKFRMK